MDPDCPVPMPTLWPSLYSLFSHQWPPDLAVSWLLWALTRPRALAQLNFVDGLGEMGHLVILILHMHKHMLRAPQDTSILCLQGDLAGKGSQCPTLPWWLSPTPGPVVYSACSSRSRALVTSRKPDCGSTAKGPSAATPESPDRTIWPSVSLRGSGSWRGENRGEESGGRAWRMPPPSYGPILYVGRLRLRERWHLPEVTKPVRNRVEIQSQSSFLCA